MTRRLRVASVTSGPLTDSPAILGGWRLIRRLKTTRWFHVDLAAPATCEPDWPADYVVKSVKPGLKGEAFAVQWLRRELEVAQHVSQAHLATVLCGQFDETPAYIVQPCYEGESLRERLSSTPLGVAQSLWVVRQAAEALDALHRHGWLHGDVKPDNLIVSPAGHTTLIDLGFAQRLARRGAWVAGTLQTTISYAAPELFSETTEPTPKADIYSLGVTLYELLGGRPPFVGSHSDIAKGHVHEMPVEIRLLNPRVPSRAARLAMQLLLKDPHRRPDAADLVDQLVRMEIECFELVA